MSENPGECAYQRCTEPQSEQIYYLCEKHYRQAWENVLSRRSKMNPRLIGAITTPETPTVTCPRGHTYEVGSLHETGKGKCKACTNAAAKMRSKGVHDTKIELHLADLAFELIERGWERPLTHSVMRDWLKKDITAVAPPKISDLDTQLCRRGHKFSSSDKTGVETRDGYYRCRACMRVTERAHRKGITDEGLMTLIADEIYQELLAETRKETKCVA